MTKRIIASLALTVLIFIGASFPAQAKGRAMMARLEGPISPAMAQFATRVIETAADEEAVVVVFTLDTPGGLADSMRTMVKSILNAPLPVIVYVSPQGAHAASAGLMVTLAAHVAAMAPGTNIGAASVVAAGGKDVGGTMGRKVTNDMVALVRSLADRRGRNADWAEKAVRYAVSLPAIEAAGEGVIDVVAPDLESVLDWADGKKVQVDAKTVVLKTKGLEIIEIKPSFRDRVLGIIANPNLAYLLLMLGILGIYLELSHPGAFLPGVVGAISLLLAFFAMQTLSISVTGLLLIILGVVLFIIELKVTSYGLLSIAGIGCLFLGSVMLFEDIEGVPAVALSVILPTVGVVSAFFLGIIFLVYRAQRGRVTTGLEGLVGSTGAVLEWSGREGKVFIHGEIWRAESDEELEPDAIIRVIDSQGLKLTVVPAKEE